MWLLLVTVLVFLNEVSTLNYVCKGKNAVAIETHVRTPISPVVITIRKSQNWVLLLHGFTNMDGTLNLKWERASLPLRHTPRCSGSGNMGQLRALN